MKWWRKMRGLTLRQESKIYEAACAGINTARIAELMNCTEEEVLATLADYQRLKNERDAWDATLEAEKAKNQ